MEILIAGGGIGGLAASIGLARSGHQVEVCEQAERLRTVGAGISLQPNAFQALETLGLAQEVMPRGVTASRASLWRSDGRLIRDFDFDGYEAETGYRPYIFHRASLLETLFDEAKRHGVDVRFGQRVESIEQQDDAVSVTMDSGVKYEADLLVGADGINSRVRSHLFGDETKRFSGYVCWRGIVDDPQLVESVDSMSEIWGRGQRFGYMRCSASQIYWFATSSCSTPDVADSDLRSTFAGWPKMVSNLLESTPTETIVFNDISDRPPIFPWAKGRITLLGDAAHPMTPNFGQGGSQAIEDAVVLSHLLQNAKAPVSALRQYEKHRNPRTKQLVEASRRFGKIAQGGSTSTRFIRDQVLTRLLTHLPNAVSRKKLLRQFDFRGHLSSLND